MYRSEITLPPQRKKKRTNITVSFVYRALGMPKWILVSVGASGDKLLVQDLNPATWYQLKVAAKNDAGEASGLFNFATTTLNGGKSSKFT